MKISSFPLDKYLTIASALFVLILSVLKEINAYYGLIGLLFLGAFFFVITVLSFLYVKKESIYIRENKIVLDFHAFYREILIDEITEISLRDEINDLTVETKISKETIKLYKFKRNSVNELISKIRNKH